jgi:8-oxo-dGTP diphosphatase
VSPEKVPREKQRHLTASAIVFDASGRILLIQHRRRGFWLYPGGHLKAGEDPVGALHRELREELGIEVDLLSGAPFTHSAVTVVPAPFAILVIDSDHYDCGVGHLDLVYLARARPGPVVRQVEELDGYAWTAPAEVASLSGPPELFDLVAAAVRHVAGAPD